MAVIDLDRIDETLTKLERAGALLATIREAGTELNELLDGSGVGITLELEAGDVHPEPQNGATPAAPASPPRPDSSPAEPPTADDEPPPAPPAPAPSPPAAPPPAPATPRPSRGPAARSADTIARIRGAFARLGPDWQTTGNIAAEAGLSPGTVSARLAELVGAGELEHNDKGGAHKRHRLKTVERHAEQAGPTTPPTEASSPSDAAPVPEPPAPSPTPAARDERTYSGLRGVSPRVRRELERERQEAELNDASDPKAGTIDGRVIEALAGGGPAGIRELARRLGRAHPDEPLLAALQRAIVDGSVRKFTNPNRTIVGQENPLFEALG